MKKALVVILVLVVAAGAFLYFPRGSALAAIDAAVLAVLNHGVDAARGGGQDFKAALDGEVFATGDVLRSNDDGRGVLTFFDGSTVSVDPKGRVRVASLAKTGSGALQVTLEQTAGRTWSSISKLAAPGSKFEIKTPSLVATVRGTLFEVLVETRADGTVVTTVRVFEGEVLVTANGGGQTTLGTGQQVTIAGNDPAPPAQPMPPTPRLRISVPAGVGITAIDPRGWQCGTGSTALARQSPRCDVLAGAGSSVVFGEVVAGTYTVLLTAAAVVRDAALVAEGLSAQGAADFSVRTTRSLNIGDLVRTSLTVAVGADGKLSASPFANPELITSVCGGEAAGRIFASGPLTDRADALVAFAATAKDTPAAIVYTQDEMTAAIAEAGGDLPVTVSDAKVTIDHAGVHLAANVTVGPLTVPTTGDVIAGAEGGRLVIKMRTFEAGPVPAFVKDLIVGAFDSAFAEFASSIPLNIQRVAFRSGCIALIGKTPK